MSLRDTHGVTRKFTTALQAITEAIDIQLSESYEAIGSKEHYDRGLLRIQTMERLPGVLSTFVAQDKSDDTILAFRDAYIEECIFHPQFPYGAVGTIRSVFNGFVNARKEATRMRDLYDSRYEECEKLKKDLELSEKEKKEEMELRVAYAAKNHDQGEALIKANAEIDSLTEEMDTLNETIALLKRELEGDGDEEKGPSVKLITTPGIPARKTNRKGKKRVPANLEEDWDD